ncbi:MAG: methyltransferase family protein [Nitrososphaerales archaeon]
MLKSIRIKALLLVPLVVFVVITIFFTLGYLITIVLGMPFGFGFGLPIRLLGLLTLACASLSFGWLFRYRKPIDVLISTYVTFSKVKRGAPLQKPSGRTEPLVVQGPYGYVRHPLYLGVVLFVLGWWLLLDYSFLLVSTIILRSWFNFVVANFEEKELRAIFGEMIPFTKRGKK